MTAMMMADREPTIPAMMTPCEGGEVGGTDTAFTSFLPAGSSSGSSSGGGGSTTTFIDYLAVVEDETLIASRAYDLVGRRKKGGGRREEEGLLSADVGVGFTRDSDSSSGSGR